MLVSSWLWIFILAFSGTVLSFEHQLLEPDPNAGFPERTGMTAIRTLLSGAKNVRSQSWTFKNYEKKGDFDTALKDFHKVVPPKDTLYMKTKRGNQGTRIWTGYVGNLAIHLKMPPSARPTIEIIDEYAERANGVRSGFPNAGNQNDIKIIYKKSKN